MNIIDRIRNIFGYYHWLFLARKEFKNIKKFKVNLEPGFYYVSCNVRTFLYRKNTPKSFLEMIGVDTSKPELLAFYKKKQCKRSVPYTCDIVMTTNEGYRLYNLKDNTTLHLFKNENEANLYRKCYSLFSPFFSFTTCEMTDAYSIETIIMNKHRKMWTKEELYSIFYALLDSLTAYLQSAEKESVDIESKIKISERAGKDYCGLCKDLLEEARSFVNPVYVFSHGDLHFGNILFDGKTQYLIDFEKARKELFFFDLYNILYVEVADYSNYSFVDDYLDGEQKMMSCFQTAFESVGSVFDVKNRVCYLKVFLLLRMNYDIENYIRNNRIDKCEGKIEIINKLIIYLDNYKKI